MTPSQKLLAVREAINKACPWLQNTVIQNFVHVEAEQHLADVMVALHSKRPWKYNIDTFGNIFREMRTREEVLAIYPLTNDTPEAWSEELVNFLYEVLVDNKK